MILKIQGFDMNIEMNQGEMVILVIEDTLLFTDIIMKCFQYSKVKGDENDVLLLENNSIVSFYNDVNVYMDIFSTDLNERKILTKIYKDLSKEINSNIEEKVEITKHLNIINQKLLYSILDIDINLVYDEEVMLETYFKAINLRIDDDYQFSDIYNKLCYIIDIEAQIAVYKCLIFINVLLYFDNDTIYKLMNYMKHKNIKILFIEKNGMFSSDINIYRIDKDFVEILPDI